MQPNIREILGSRNLGECFQFFFCFRYQSKPPTFNPYNVCKPHKNLYFQCYFQHYKEHSCLKMLVKAIPPDNFLRKSYTPKTIHHT